MSVSTTAERGPILNPASVAESVDVNAVFDDGAQIDAALAEAVRDAILFHKRMENPIAIWFDGKVMWLSPNQIPG